MLLLKKNLLFLFYLLLFAKVISQKEFNQWHMGNRVSINFNSNPPIVNNNSNSNTAEGTASVADCEGNLLFYTNGITIWNKNNARMDNGENILGDVGNTSPALIIRDPYSTVIYYLFTSSNDDGLRYSIINMNSNGGLGRVINKNILIRNLPTGKLNVAKHANGKDVWMVTHYNNSRNYEAFLINQNGVNLNGIVSAGNHTHRAIHGDITISPDGKKICTALDVINPLSPINSNEGVALADFDPSTGTVSSEAFLNLTENPHGCDFSSNSRYLYVNSTNVGAYQFDLTLGSNTDILNSRKSLNGTPKYGSLRLAPNGVIYISNNIDGLGSSNVLAGILNVDNSNAFINNNALNLISGSSGYGIVNTILPNEDSFNGPNEILANENCFGEAIAFRLLNENNIIEVLWDFDDPESGNNTSINLRPSHNFSKAGTFRVSITILYECGSETIYKDVVVAETPEISLNDTIKACALVPINIGTNNSNSYIYKWTPSTYLSDINSPNPLFNHRGNTEFSSYNYSVKVSIANSECEINYPITVNLVTPMLNPGPSREICFEDTIIIGTPARENYTYSWSPNNYFNNPNLAQQNVIGTNQSKNDFMELFTLSGTLESCTLDSTIFVLQRALPQLDFPKIFEVCSGDSFSMNPNFIPEFTYTWLNTLNLSNTDSPNPTFFARNYSDTIELNHYPVAIRRALCTAIDTITIELSPQSGIDNYQYLCPGFGTQLYPYGPGNFWSWSPDTDIDFTQTKNPIVNPSSSTWYYLNVTDDFGCTYEDSVFIDVNPSPTLNTPDSVQICFGDSIEVVATGITEAQYLWTPSEFTFPSDSAVTRLFPSDTTLFYLTVTVDTCSAFDSTLILVAPLPKVILYGDTAICYGDSINLIANGAESYLWVNPIHGIFFNHTATVSPTDTTIYWVIGTDENSCSNKDSAHIIVWQLPQIIIPKDTALCFGDSIWIEAQAEGLSYQWEPQEWTSNPNAQNTLIFPTRDTLFTLTAMDLNQCKNQDTLFASVYPLPIIKSIGDSLICEGNTAYFWANGGKQFRWNASVFDSTIHLPNFYFNVHDAFDIHLEVLSEFNCLSKKNISISTNPQALASFNYTMQSDCNGFTLDFENLSTQSDEWLWLFGDGRESDLQNPKVSFDFGTHIETQLIVSNNKTCYDTLKTKWDFLNIKDFAEVTAPNIITPDNNKLNDCFIYTINGNFEDCQKLEVFNRWGMKVFDTNQFDGCFEGINRYNNQKLAPGTYFYVISIKDYTHNGFIQVVYD